MAKIGVLIVDDIAETRENIKKLLQFESDMEIVGTAKTGREAVALAKEKRPHVVIMDINMHDMDGIAATEQISKDVPSAQIVILSVQSDADYLRRAMMAGARDFLTKPPSGDELINTIRRAYEISKTRSAVAPTQSAQTSAAQAATVVDGKIITVYSAKGGVGCTMLATNLAVALHTEETKVALVDCNLQFGDVGAFMNLPTKHSVIELCEKADELDIEFINSVATPHNSGVKTFLAPISPEQADVATAAQVKKTLDFLRHHFSYVIVDTASALTEITLSIIDVSDRIVLVTTPDIPSIKDARLFFNLIDALEFPADRVLFILNRADKRAGIQASNIQDSLKHEIVAQVPGDERVVLASINSGVPLLVSNRNVPTAQGILEVASKLKTSFAPPVEKDTTAPPADPKKPAPPRRLFGS
ncbi:MAG: response regulator [Chloroflexi bacterium]|nr:response regulator [Chloroflexota bacterium]